MSRIDNLVKELCPDGVDYKPLATLFDTRNGYTPRKTDAEAWSGDEVPWFRMEDIRANGGILDDSIQRISKSAVKGGRLFAADSILVATSATIGEHALIRVPHLSNQRFTCLTLKDEYRSRFDVKFLYYYCFRLDEWCKKNTTVSSFQSVDMVGFKRFRFPIPPLAVQREIVRVLDQFTQLEAELEAELEARRRQYEYYRHREMTFSGSVTRSPLGELVQVKTGAAVSKRLIQENPGPYPVINSGREPLGYIGEYNTEGNPVGITSRGAGVGSITWCEGRYYRGNLNYGVTVKDVNELDVRFLYHSLQYMQPELRALCSFQGIPALNKASLERLVIPLPDMAVQMKVVSILDKFDALVNDLNSGLPAEIAARRKQYEYYRDKLLAFPEKGAAA
ncbi:restriction endonuclease subunit S [Actinomyces glycerinitolerans]|uniref:Restriction endonuclease type i hsds n=1 Tax=Actinomyces glycerinitolerans TaxID=1892869 RepID=A0A1M4RZS6_9ACTO|nr:restriction endonuclease subunit S [Actinomyces glycerinitolerans]SHE25473.1 restriction endonuclease type i hsds [Actinomyces glycerinitolerans]